MAKIKTYDLICIGGGSAGFNAARVAIGLGKKVAVIDGAKQLGGLCILRGCMPSKTLIYAAEILHHAQHADRFGLKVTGARADMAAVHARKKRIIGDFASYRAKALVGGKFDLFRAYARFTGAIPTYFPINHGTLGFTPYVLEPSSPNSPTDGLTKTY